MRPGLGIFATLAVAAALVACGGGGSADGGAGGGDASAGRDVSYGWDAWSPGGRDAGAGGADGIVGTDTLTNADSFGDSDDGPGADATGGDAVTSEDAPSAPDSADPADDATDWDVAGDATEPRAFEADLFVPTSWQRGPVTLPVTFDGGAPPYVAALSFSTDGGASWRPMARLAGYGDTAAETAAAGRYSFVWDSFADVSEDLDVTVRLAAADSAGGEAIVDRGPFRVAGDPDRDRVALVTSALNGNNKVRRLIWRHGEGFTWDGVVHEVGARPIQVAFDPGGRAAAILEEEERAITFYSFGESGDIARTIPFPTPGINPSDGMYSGDGATLFVASFDSTEDAGVWTLATDPWTGLPAEGAVLTPFYLRKVSGHIALLPDGRGLLVFGSTMGDPLGALRLDVVGPDGGLVDHAYFGAEGTLASCLGLAPNGRWALAGGHNLFETADELTLFEVGADGVLEEHDAVPVEDPDDVEFHSSSLSAVVSEAEGDALLPVAITPEGLLEAGDALWMPIATEIASPVVGSDRDVFFVATVWEASGVAVVHLDADGDAEQESTFSLGAGAIPAGLAIQP